ncbi:hypothetical protein IMZ48_48335 [Candidatus Bathyarchaeota archaeon]|nr:hypothetical protein [Candidatus Bathyarchaeota archaeon]
MRIAAAIEGEGKWELADIEQYRGETEYRMSAFYTRNDRVMDRYGGDGAGALAISVRADPSTDAGRRWRNIFASMPRVRLVDAAGRGRRKFVSQR